MADLYRLAGSDDSSADGTTEVILARDSDGNPSKVVSSTTAVSLSKDEKDKLEAQGLGVEKVTAEEAKSLAQGQQVGADIAGSAPSLGDGNDK